MSSRSPNPEVALLRALGGVALVLATASLVGVAVTDAATARPPTAGIVASAHAAASTTTCDVRHDGRSLGPTYVTSLKVQHVSCATGIAVVRAYYRCRVHAGGVRGACHSLVLGYRCHEQRQGIAIQFDAKVTCTRGTRKVVHTYVQDT